MSMSDLIREQAGYGAADTEAEGEPSPPSFDGGARSPLPPAPPTMSTRLRADALAARHHLPPDEALRQIQSQQR